MTRLPRALLLVTAILAGAAGAAAQGGTREGAADPRTIVGAPRGQALSGAALDAATHDTAVALRCPVCQGLSIADSPTELARTMKQQVREMLAAGYAREQVLGYFEASYGEFVRLQPPLRGVNWLVWVAPLAGLLAGGYIVTRALRRAPGAAGASAEAQPVEDDEALAPYLLRVREMAYGWPDGRPPRSTDKEPA